MADEEQENQQSSHHPGGIVLGVERMVDAAKDDGIEADKGFGDILFPFPWLVAECDELCNKFDDCECSEDENQFSINFLSLFLKLG